MRHFKARTVRWEPPAESQLPELTSRITNFAHQIAAAEWAISSNAEYFELLHGTRFRCVHTRLLPSTVSLRVFFTINNDDECSIWWVEDDTSDGHAGGS